MVQAGFGRPERDAETIRDVGQRQPHVVVEYKDSALLERQPPEGPLQLVAIDDGQDAGRLSRLLDPKDADVRRPPRATPGLGVALVGQDSMQPGLEAVWIAERPELPPGHDQRRLHGVLGKVGIAKDPNRDRHAPIADHASERVEGLLVASLRLVHELVLVLHLASLNRADQSDPIK